MKKVSKSIAYRLIAGLGLILYFVLTYAYKELQGVDWSQTPSFFSWYLIAFAICVLLSSALIDVIRIETNWHPVIKWLCYLVIFFIFFVAFLIVVVYLEAIRFG